MKESEVKVKSSCIICKRKLSNPKSIERKMGDTCYRKYLAGYKGIQAKIGGIP
jgi:hypothetical protein